MDISRRVWLATVLTALFSIAGFAQKIGVPTTRCDVGLFYQISYQANWGDSHAIVVEVIPGLPADVAGIKAGDIIETINGVSSQEMSEEEINNVLLNPNEGTVDMEVSNFGYTKKKVTIRKRCVPVNAISEAMLARSFNMYSLEDVTNRRFAMPFTYKAPEKIDFRQYGSFSFATGRKPTVLQSSVHDALVKKGLEYVQSGGDLTVSVGARLEANPEYRSGAESEAEQGMKNYRVNAQTGDIQQYPFHSLNSPAFVGTHLLSMTIEIADAKAGKLIWSVSAGERLNGEYGLESYAQNFTPLMLSNFPFVRYISNPSFVLHKNTYRSIGIYLDAEDLQRILWVEKDSPADKAGLHVGDRILTINGLPLDSSVDKMTRAYIDFIKKTLKHRDEESRFPSSDGFQTNKYWRLDRYADIALVMQDPKNKAAFSYLFSHRDYVHTTPITDIVLEIKRGEEVIPIAMKPVLKKEDYIELL
ncbi:MAG: PDZ domain-containing protein [Porphyromonas sp.]|nr:PDZ domain-containing protein [Porphyromonas sp.]